MIITRYTIKCIICYSVCSLNVNGCIYQLEIIMKPIKVSKCRAIQQYFLS